MHEKLPLLMKSEGLTSSRLAELLGIQPSGISHLISGRNKPSYDLLQKILRRFPNINPDWLLLDSDEMYRTKSNTEPNSLNSVESKAEAQTQVTNPNEVTTVATEKNLESKSGTEVVSILSTQADGGSQRKVKRVILLYNDHSFESYEIK